MRRKWSKNLPNVDFFIKQVERKSPEIDPYHYYYKSEDYFTKLLFMKPISCFISCCRKEKEKEEE